MKSPFAYLVEDEERCSVTFAFNDAHAQQVGASKFWSEAEAVTAKRMPEYDRYSLLGYVPPLILLNEVYAWTSCDHCGIHIHTGGVVYNDDGDEIKVTPVAVDNLIYCSEGCRKADEEARERHRIMATQVRAVLRSRWPGISRIFVYAGDNRLSATFRFPGGRYLAEWSCGQPESVVIRQDDLAAWEAAYGAARVVDSEVVV